MYSTSCWINRLTISITSLLRLHRFGVIIPCVLLYACGAVYALNMFLVLSPSQKQSSRCQKVRALFQPELSLSLLVRYRLCWRSLSVCVSGSCYSTNRLLIPTGMEKTWYWRGPSVCLSLILYRSLNLSLARSVNGSSSVCFWLNFSFYLYFQTDW